MPIRGGSKRKAITSSSNLHDDCLICTGEFNRRYASGTACVAASLEQFRKSQWNADLMRTVECSQQFFRFEPTNDAFTTLPIVAADTTTLCDKVHELARFQMGVKVTVDFPDAWRTNLVEVREERRERVRAPRWELEPTEPGLPQRFRVDEALEQIHGRCGHCGITEQQWLAALGRLAADEVCHVIVEACLHHGVMPDELLAEMAQGTIEY